MLAWTKLFGNYQIIINFLLFCTWPHSVLIRCSIFPWIHSYRIFSVECEIICHQRPFFSRQIVHYCSSHVLYLLSLCLCNIDLSCTIPDCNVCSHNMAIWPSFPYCVSGTNHRHPFMSIVCSPATTMMREMAIRETKWSTRGFLLALHSTASESGRWINQCILSLFSRL